MTDFNPLNKSLVSAFLSTYLSFLTQAKKRGCVIKLQGGIRHNVCGLTQSTHIWVSTNEKFTLQVC